MNSDVRRARAIALLLDLLIPAAVADAAGLLLTAAVWYLAPVSSPPATWIWLPAALAALSVFLLRDRRGGRARRWLALEVRDREGQAPGGWGSIRRNLPLLVPGWNLIEAWPVLRDGRAARPSDRRRGFEVAPCD
ncbi:MAG: hypothetical protein ACM3SU_14790 [Acidobacteriota bacterium]